ncbi:spike base protein, RCAP_Rcc01079 family [Nevskia sp.]|uniref:spike base protein, RCAP_Rcc01079 family n=1 Tax=Nevskia sp. TaxID=1929292 RepID=UPI003F72ABDD
MSATTEAELQQAASITRRMVEIMAAVAQGGPAQTVNNGQVDLPTLAKFFADAQAQVNAAVAVIVATPTGGQNPAPIIPSDTAVLAGLVGGMEFITGGLVVMEFSNGQVIPRTFAPGEFYPNNPSRVRATGTDVGIQIIGYFI